LTPNRLRTAALALGALGVVYGDIGTNPLFAIREAFDSRHAAVGVNEANVLGLLSLIFWSLVIVISLKNLTFVMRVDNDGEGGIVVPAAVGVLIVLFVFQRKGTATIGRFASHPGPGMARWWEHLFTFTSRNASSAADYFGLPSEQTLELVLAVEL
jgi:K+ transporter